MEGNKILLKTAELGKEIVLKSSRGITFRTKEEDGVTIIEAVKTARYTGNYKEPVIPEGFEYVKGEWNKGFVIRNKVDGSEFVWVPVGVLEADGTLDGVNFTEKFGRRIFDYKNFCGKFGRFIFYDKNYSDDEEYYCERIDRGLLYSIKEYGGFYISAYVASKEKSNIVFKKGNMPFKAGDGAIYAQELAAEYAGDNTDICSCLPYGAVYDTLYKWIIQEGEKSFAEVCTDSSSWGNYYDPKSSSNELIPTGSKEEYCVFNIYDLAGNCKEITAEKSSWLSNVHRGGSYIDRGKSYPVNNRWCNQSNDGSSFGPNSFRVVIYVKV